MENLLRLDGEGSDADPQGRTYYADEGRGEPVADIVAAKVSRHLVEQAWPRPLRLLRQ